MEYQENIYQIIISMFLAYLFIIIVSYIIHGISCSKLAKNNGHEDIAYYAWIPILNIYLLGILAGKNESKNIDCKKLSLIYIIATFLLYFFKIGFISFVYFVTVVISSYMIYVSLYRRMGVKNAVFISVLSVLIPFVSLIYIFIKRNTIFTD